MQHNPDAPWYTRLHWQVFIAMALGALAGAVFGLPLAERIGWIGDLFMRLLRMIIVPLVFASIMSGVASAGSGAAIGRLFSKTWAYYIGTSIIAITVGLVMVNLIGPGKGANLMGAEVRELPELATPSGPVELILDIVPQNIFVAASNADMLAIIFFAIVFGASISALPIQQRDFMRTLVDGLFTTMMILTEGIIRFLPIGVFALIARMVAMTGTDSFGPFILYVITLASGLTIHMFVMMSLLLILLGRISPRIHLLNMREPLLVAFSTSSSAATMPVLMNTLQKKVGVSQRVTSFVVPMGTTVNMDGTALFECVGAIFIAQVLGYELTFAQQAIVVLTALLASIGAAAIPSAGLVVIFIVLEAIGLRGPEVNLIVGSMLAIDRPLDMYRTAVNVYSDSVASALIARSEGETGVDTEVR